MRKLNNCWKCSEAPLAVPGPRLHRAGRIKPLVPFYSICKGLAEKDRIWPKEVENVSGLAQGLENPSRLTHIDSGLKSLS